MIGKGVELRPDIAEIQPREEQSARDRELRKSCKEFESVFTYQLLRSMRRTVEKCDLFHGGSGEDVYEALLDQELSKSMAGMGERGLADLLYQQLRRKQTGEPRGEGGAPPLEAPAPPTPLQPVHGRVSSAFGWRTHPIHGDRRFHHGLDIAAGEGTPIKTTLPGRVVESGYRGGYGNVVKVDHGHGFTTLYAHNRENLVQKGAWVHAGDPVALVGSTGDSTGPHLHFEVRRHGRPVNPAEFLGVEPERSVAEARPRHLSPKDG